MALQKLILFLGIFVTSVHLTACEVDPGSGGSGGDGGPVVLTSIAWADANLEACVINSTGVGEENEGATMSNEIITLTAFGCWSGGIADLGGIEYLTNLTELVLDTNSIVDVSQLSGLTKLTALNLSYNYIVDISPLAGMTAMDTLNVGNNVVTTGVDTLVGMTAATYLDLFPNIGMSCAELQTLLDALYPSVLLSPTEATDGLTCTIP